MSLRAQVTIDRNRRVTLEHAQYCPVNTKSWPDCNCGLFKGWNQPLAHAGNHTENCPCHCTCDFDSIFVKIVKVSHSPPPKAPP